MVKYKPCAGTEKPALSLFLLSMIAVKSASVILYKPMFTKVPTMERTIFRKKRLAEMVKIKLSFSCFQCASKIVQSKVFTSVLNYEKHLKSV